jgi:hypothetical protein
MFVSLPGVFFNAVVYGNDNDDDDDGDWSLLAAVAYCNSRSR